MNTGHKTKVPLQPMPVPTEPMAMTAMDVVGPLPLTTSGNQYILVFTDYMSRFPEAFPMPNQKTKTVAKILVEDICCRYGTPKVLLTDLGTNFWSELLEEVTKFASC